MTDASRGKGSGLWGNGPACCVGPVAPPQARLYPLQSRRRLSRRGDVMAWPGADKAQAEGKPVRFGSTNSSRPVPQEDARERVSDKPPPPPPGLGQRGPLLNRYPLLEDYCPAHVCFGSVCFPPWSSHGNLSSSPHLRTMRLETASCS